MKTDNIAPLMCLQFNKNHTNKHQLLFYIKIHHLKVAHSYVCFCCLVYLTVDKELAMLHDPRNTLLDYRTEQQKLGRSGKKVNKCRN